MFADIPLMKKIRTYTPANMTMRVTPVQKEIMVNFMETHPNLVNGKIGRNLPGGESSGLWKELTDILNASGGNVTKNPEKWRKTWSDMKRDVKEKAARIREQQKQAVPPAGLEERLTPLQEKLLGLVSKMEEMPEEENPSEMDLLGSETDASKSGNAEDIVVPEPDASKERSPLEIDVKNWGSGELLKIFTIKQEQRKDPEQMEEGTFTQQETLFPIQEQNGVSKPPTKKARRLSSAETSATSTTIQAEVGSSEKQCTRHYSYATLAEHQAATASALNRLADVAERRLSVEERKAVAMERFVEIFFKQQQTAN